MTGETEDTGCRLDGDETIAYQFEVRHKKTEDDFHTTIQTEHPSETFGKISHMEYRNVRELVHRE